MLRLLKETNNYKTFFLTKVRPLFKFSPKMDIPRLMQVDGEVSFKRAPVVMEVDIEEDAEHEALLDSHVDLLDQDQPLADFGLGHIDYENEDHIEDELLPRPPARMGFYSDEEEAFENDSRCSTPELTEDEEEDVALPQEVDDKRAKEDEEILKKVDAILRDTEAEEDGVRNEAEPEDVGAQEAVAEAPVEGEAINEERGTCAVVAAPKIPEEAFVEIESDNYSIQDMMRMENGRVHDLFLSHFGEQRSSSLFLNLMQQYREGANALGAEANSATDIYTELAFSLDVQASEKPEASPSFTPSSESSASPVELSPIKENNVSPELNPDNADILYPAMDLNKENSLSPSELSASRESNSLSPDFSPIKGDGLAPVELMPVKDEIEPENIFPEGEDFVQAPEDGQVASVWVRKGNRLLVDGKEENGEK